jgi:hypothetical protein
MTGHYIHPREEGRPISSSVFDLLNNNKTYPSRILLAETGPFDSFFFCPSPSADTLKRSSTSPVFIEPRPEFCCVTTEEAMFILNRCRLSSAYIFIGWGDLPHDLFLQCPPGYQPVYIDHLSLTQSMGSVHSLKILHWIPIVVDKDYRVRSRQVQSQTTNAGC